MKTTFFRIRPSLTHWKLKPNDRRLVFLRWTGYLCKKEVGASIFGKKRRLLLLQAIKCWMWLLVYGLPFPALYLINWKICKNFVVVLLNWNISYFSFCFVFTSSCRSSPLIFLSGVIFFFYTSIATICYFNFNFTVSHRRELELFYSLAYDSDNSTFRTMMNKEINNTIS